MPKAEPAESKTLGEHLQIDTRIVLGDDQHHAAVFVHQEQIRVCAPGNSPRNARDCSTVNMARVLYGGGRDAELASRVNNVIRSAGKTFDPRAIWERKTASRPIVRALPAVTLCCDRGAMDIEWVINYNPKHPFRRE